MKTKLTVTIDEKLIPQAKRYACSHGLSLSQVIESALRELSQEPKPSFSEKWRGLFQPANKKNPRYRHLAKKYL